MKKLILGAFVALAACQNPTQQAAKTEALKAKTVEVGKVKVNEAEAMPIADVMKEAENHLGHAMTYKGTVAEVCSKKGCWMTLQAGNTEPVRITFKDYAFFVPKDLAGKEVALVGQMQKETVSVAMQKHLAEDAKKSKAEIAMIKDPITEFSIVAEGVKVLN
jgi:hypothetical protein